MTRKFFPLRSHFSAIYDSIIASFDDDETLYALDKKKRRTKPAQPWNERYDRETTMSVRSKSFQIEFPEMGEKKT